MIIVSDYKIQITRIKISVPFYLNENFDRSVLEIEPLEEKTANASFSASEILSKSITQIS